MPAMTFGDLEDLGSFVHSLKRMGFVRVGPGDLQPRTFTIERTAANAYEVVFQGQEQDTPRQGSAQLIEVHPVLVDPWRPERP